MSVLSRFFDAIGNRKPVWIEPPPSDGVEAIHPDYKLNWTSVASLGGVLELGDIRVHVCMHEDHKGKPSSPRDFVLVKTPGMVEEFVDIARAIKVLPAATMHQRYSS